MAKLETINIYEKTSLLYNDYRNKFRVFCGTNNFRLNIEGLAVGHVTVISFCCEIILTFSKFFEN